MNNCNAGSKLTGHLQNVILQFVVVLLLFLQPHFSVTVLLHLSWENLSFFFSSIAAVFFLTCFEHSRARKS